MRIELHTPDIGRWYWCSYPVSHDVYNIRLVVTQMNPRNIAVGAVACKVYGCCEYVTNRTRLVGTDAGAAFGFWRAKVLGMNLSRDDSVMRFDTADAAKAWLLAAVARRSRQAPLNTPRYASAFSLTYTYEAIVC